MLTKKLKCLIVITSFLCFQLFSEESETITNYYVNVKTDIFVNFIVCRPNHCPLGYNEDDPDAMYTTSKTRFI